MICHEIREEALRLAEGKTVTRLTCGPYFVAVSLSDGSCGLSFQFPYSSHFGEEMQEIAGSAAGRPAADFCDYICSVGLQSSAIGIALANALTAKTREGLPGGDFYDYIDITQNDVVGIIGNFGKMNAKIAEMCGELRVFEFNPAKNQYPAHAEPLLLPDCDIVAMTASTLVNKTVDQVVENCKNAREIVLLGPTAVDMPEVFKKHGFTYICGARVEKPELAHSIISEGANGAMVIKKTTQAFTRKL